MNEKHAFRTVILIAALTTAVGAIVFFTHRPVLSAGAVSFDDNQYLMDDNPLVQRPSLKSAWQILTEVLNPSTVTGYYQPLSVISIMLDYAIGGSAENLLPFHRTNLILHILNTALIIILLYIIFDKPVPAAMAGLLFGVHPLTVEPVAWISDRKTLLAMFFALWCLIFYVRYARTNNRGHYITSIVMYVFAMMSKPTSLPLAVALLVMDYWPLQRINAKNIKAALFEKLPFFALGGIFAVITLISNARNVGISPAGSAATKLSQLPLVICYLISFYLKKIIWPVNLSSVYPLPGLVGLSNPKILVGVITTVIIVVVLIYSARRTRVFLGGGLFSLAVIFPTLGLVRFSPWVIASDKYVYMPAAGLLMILTWSLGWLWQRLSTPTVRRLAVVLPIFILAAGEIYGVRKYLVYWHDTIGLYEYIIKAAPNAPVAHNNLGVALKSAGRLEEAITQFRQTIQLDPSYPDAHNNLGAALRAEGKLDEAVNEYMTALRLRPNFADAIYNLGNALRLQGKIDEAQDCLRQLLQNNPRHFEAHNNLGIMLQSQGKTAEAMEHFRQAILIRPYDVDAQHNLAEALKLQGNYDEAIINYRQALKAAPDNAVIHNNLGNLLRAANRPDEAEFEFSQALKYKPDFAEAHYNLGNILTQHDRIDEAESHFRQAVRFKPDLAKAHNNLGNILQFRGKTDEALICFRRAIELDPNYVSALNSAARILATQQDAENRNARQALAFAQRASELTNRRDPAVLDTLAIAYASDGQFEKAEETAEAALKLASAQQYTQLADEIRSRLQLYRQKKPYRGPSN